MAKLQSSSSFQPSVEWTQDPQNHVLRLQLPGNEKGATWNMSPRSSFQKDEFSVRTSSFSGRLTVKGKRSLGDGNYICLDQAFEVPKDSHFDEIKAKFEGGCLSLFIPKKVIGKEVPVSLEDESRKGLETIIKNTNVIAVAVLAFSVGLYVALKPRSSGA